MGEVRPDRDLTFFLCCCLNARILRNTSETKLRRSLQRPKVAAVSHQSAFGDVGIGGEPKLMVATKDFFNTIAQKRTLLILNKEETISRRSPLDRFVDRGASAPLNDARSLAYHIEYCVRLREHGT